MTPAPLRIAVLSLHTSPLAPPGGHKTGGMNVYVRELSRELGRGGTYIDIFTRGERGDEPRCVELGDRVRVIHLESAPATTPADGLAAYADAFTLEIALWARDEGARYDIVHSHYWASTPTGAALSRRWQTPHVVMFHTLGEVKNRVRPAEREPESRIAIERAAVASADRIVCSGEHEAHLLERIYGARRDQLALIPCGVDLDRFAPGDRTAARAGLGLGDEPLVLYVGRIEPLKGIDLLINAMALVELPDGTPPPRLVVLGGDERSAGDVASLRRLADGFGIGERVAFRGSAGRDELPRYYRAADVCVVPSFYESFGLVAVEAMACGTPVVASRVGGLATTVRDGVTGYLVPWRCPEPFAERIELVLANTHLRDSLGHAAHESARAFRWDAVASQVRSVYDGLTAAAERSAS